MEALVTVHVATGVALVAVAALVGVWGLLRARSIAQARPGAHEAAWFRQALALSQTLVLASGVFGLLVLVGGRHPADRLHLTVYGPFMVVALVVAWGLRGPSRVANVRVFAVTALVICALGVRAVFTG